MLRRPLLAVSWSFPRCIRSNPRLVIVLNKSTYLTRTNWDKKPFYVTTPIFYVNASPHVGHLHSMVFADVLKRWREFISGTPAFLTTGTDEHGNKVDQAAKKAGIQTKAFVDTVSETFLKLADLFDIKYDRFIRTTDRDHAKASQELFKILQERGYIYKGKHQGWYCVSDETFYPETQVTKTTDPSTGNDVMVSIETGKSVEWTSEENYFFALSKLQRPLLEHYKACRDFVLPRVRHEALAREIQRGLGDLSVSRPSVRCPWGIPVPGDDSQVMYVWLDALTNYMTSTGFPWESNATYESCVWPANAHIIGKDIERFHAIYWPAFLLAAGIALPHQVIIHSHWTIEGSKMSKSTGNVVDPAVLAAKFGTDSVKFFLMNDAHLDHDSPFSVDRIVERHNTLVVNKYGNLTARICGAKFDICRSLTIEAEEIFSESGFGTANILERYKSLRQDIDSLVDRMDENMKKGEPSRALAAVWDVLSTAQTFVQEAAPWKLKDPDELGRQDAIIQVGAEAVRVASIVLTPFLPGIAPRMLDRLSVSGDKRAVSYARYGDDKSYGVGANRKGDHVVTPVTSND